MKNLVQLLRFLLRNAHGVRSPRLSLAWVIALGVASGLASTALIATVNQVLATPDPPPRLAAGFVALCLALPLARFGSERLLIRLTQGLVHDLWLRMSRRLLALPLRRQEEIGPARFLAALTDDVGQITAAAQALPLLSMNLAVVGGIVLYLGWLSWQLLAVLAAFLVLALASYRLPLRAAYRHLVSARERRDELFAGFRDLTEGGKELKLHRGRREAFFAESLAPAAAGLHRRMVRARTLYAFAGSWGQTLGFVFLGLLLFVVAERFPIDSSVLTGYALGSLYLAWPIESILLSLDELGRGRVATDKLEELGLTPAVDRGEASPATGAADGGWQRIELAAVRHSYRRAGARGSALGRLDLTFRPGELVFIAGGNGSGKTTLAKLICGLYAPQQGEVILDGQPIDDGNRDDYRQLFSAVFSDFHLFTRLLGIGGRERESAAQSYLEQLELDRQVTIEGGAFSTVDLSRGQRKRLALLVAYLEDRPILLFDEWAADQDPAFKEVFYRRLLPELKARGKTVWVISHDHTYYDLADRILRLDEGQVVYDGTGDGYRRWLASSSS